MCDVCGCGDPTIVSEDLHRKILSDNDHVAAHNREHFVSRGVLSINLMGSPGAGKTALLEATRRAAPELRLAAVSGDLATEHDASRLEAVGVPARTITTGTACHLDASMVHHALHDWSDLDADVFFIENVGNLVCPAIYDLGQTANVVALSTTEGPDKPLKYPVIFYKADLVLLTKADLLPHLPDVEPKRIFDALMHVMPEPRMIVLSAITGEGLDEWLGWLRAQASNRELDRELIGGIIDA
ncbi:MAG: hydrogenase nickel incorporation protein HypB [Deltaproteobacteria bacterium]|nr:hydrogenase nickel incorporation protein HypB [Deltaproteobacteria bacterium]MBW2697563.1 hydrogenase nickel incorporation protein HypB [Deltaproteobacteria bacterium]